MDASPVHTTKDAHHKSYTTLLPNTDIYVMNKSANKCTSGILGRPKNNVLVYNLYFFPAKKEEKTKKCQRDLKNSQIWGKTNFLDSEFLLLYWAPRKWSKWVKPNNTGQKLAKRGLTNNTGRKWIKLIYTKWKEVNLLLLGGYLIKSIVLLKKSYWAEKFHKVI